MFYWRGEVHRPGPDLGGGLGEPVPMASQFNTSLQVVHSGRPRGWAENVVGNHVGGSFATQRAAREW